MDTSKGIELIKQTYIDTPWRLHSALIASMLAGIAGADSDLRDILKDTLTDWGMALATLRVWANVDDGSTFNRLVLSWREANDKKSWPTPEQLEASPGAWLLEEALTRTLADYAATVLSGSPADYSGKDPWFKHVLINMLNDLSASADIVNMVEDTNPMRLIWAPDKPEMAIYPRLLAHVLWHNQVKPHLEGAPPNYPRIYGRSGDTYAGAPKVLSGISWAIDGPGVVIDGDKYAEAPGVRYWPRTLEVLPDGRRPHQQTLGAVLYDQAPVSLAVQAVQSASSVLGVNESKLALLFMLSGHAPCSTTLAELAKELMPDKSRIRKRDYERIVLAIRNMRRMTIALPNNTDVQLFDLAAPLSADLADRGQHVSWQYSRSFELLLAKLAAKDATLGRAGMLAGEFLINVSAFMRFDGNQGNLARQYLAACAMFNDSQSPYAPPTYSRESWALYANALSPATTQLLLEGKGTRADQAAKARDLAAAERDLSTLADMGLIVVDGNIKRDRFTLRPPEEWNQAHKERRKKGARIDPDK